MDFEIRGLTTFGNYTPPSIAVVERYDPFKRTIVRDFIYVGGGVGSTPISVVSGAPSGTESQPSMGEVRISVYPLGGIKGGRASRVHI